MKEIHVFILQLCPIVKELLRNFSVRGANREVKSNKDQTSEMLTRENKFDNIADILEKKGFCKRWFFGENNVTAIKGNKNNLLMFFLIMFTIKNYIFFCY